MAKAKGADKKLPKINLYRNISISFAVFTAMLAVAVILFFSNKAAIIITPEKQEIKLSFNVAVKTNPTADELAQKDIIAGQMSVKEKTGAEEFPVLSTKTVEAAIVGQVKIINNGGRDQALVKTTQLQAANGTIVRTNENVIVPAGGEVTVSVYPKDPAGFTPVEPGNLKIIKLASSLQDKIYGVAAKRLADEPQEIKVLAESDVNRAQQELLDKLLAEVKKESDLGPKDKIVGEVVSAKTTPKVGSEANTFKLDLTVKAKILELDQEQLVALINRKVAALDLAGLRLASVDVNNVEYLIVNDNAADGVLVKVNYTLNAALDLTNEILAEKNFSGKTIAEVNEYLAGQDLIKEHQVIVSPYWRKTLPTSMDKIRIILK